MSLISTTFTLHIERLVHNLIPEEVGHCMLQYIRDQILELAKQSLLVVVVIYGS